MHESEASESRSWEEALGELTGKLEDGASVFDAVRDVGERVTDVLLEKSDQAAELAGRLAEAFDGIGETFGPLGERTRDLLQGAMEFAKRGTEWMAEHPEVLSAAVRLVVFVAVCLDRPEILSQLTEQQPGAIEDLIKSLAPLLR